MPPKKRQNPDSSSSAPKKVKGKAAKTEDVKTENVFSNDFFSSLQSAISKGQVSNDQKTQIKNLRVEADSVIASKYGKDSNTHKVYIDADGIVYDATLNMSDAQNNNNKFYVIQLLTDLAGTHFETFVRWGRVGEPGTTGRLEADASIQKPGSTYDRTLDSALAAFKKQFKSKTGITWDDRQNPGKPGKYVFLPRDYEAMHKEVTKKSETEISKTPVQVPDSKLPPQVQKLVELIFDKKHMIDVMSKMKYDNDSRPLGQLSEWTLSQGYSALKAISEILSKSQVDANDFAQVASLSNTYFSYIPHVINRGSRPEPIRSLMEVESEAQLLQSLGYMIEANSIAEASEEQKINPIDAKYDGLGMTEMTPLTEDSKEFKELAAYLNGTIGSTHNQTYNIQDIFRIERKGEFARLDTSDFGKANKETRNRKLLWHGSRLTNFAGILSQGLRIAPAEAPVSGYAFGKGIYLADMSSKSAQYCHPYSTGGIGLMLLCEAELGKQWKLPWGDIHAPEGAKSSGCWSTKGEGRMFPEVWKDAKCVHPSLKGIQIPNIAKKLSVVDSGVGGHALYYNEYICYDVAQVRLRYIFRLDMNHRV